MTTAATEVSTAALDRSAVAKPRNLGQIIRWMLLFIGGIAMIMPIVYMISTSLKWPHEIYNVNLIPEEPTIENYTYVLEDGRFYWWFVNSMIIATITTISNVLFDSLLGYTLCKYRFPGRMIVFIAVLSTLMIPTEMLVIPWYLMSQSFGWLDSYWGIMFPGLMTAFGTFLMKQFFESVPDDFLEAARIDGLNEPVGLSGFGDEVDVAWELIMTGAAISTIPTLVVFLVFQRYIIRGVVMAGLKG